MIDTQTFVQKTFSVEQRQDMLEKMVDYLTNQESQNKLLKNNSVSSYKISNATFIYHRLGELIKEALKSYKSTQEASFLQEAENNYTQLCSYFDILRENSSKLSNEFELRKGVVPKDSDHSRKYVLKLQERFKSSPSQF